MQNGSKLRQTAATTLLLGLLAPATSAQSTLPNGVCAGDTTFRTVVLWTRSIAPGTVAFEVALDPEFTNIVAQAEANAGNALRPLRQKVRRLEPGTRYYYRATNAEGDRANGTFRTPAKPRGRVGLTFGASGDWRGDLAPYPAVRNAAGANLDFFLALGDTIYADVESPALPGVEQARKLREFLIKHDEVYRVHRDLNTLADLRGSTSVYATIDDHKVTNDFAGGAHPSSDPRFDNRGAFINETKLYARGLKAFQQFNPLRDERYRDTGDPRTAGKRKLYRYRTFGLDAALIMLDARSFRDEPIEDLRGLEDPKEIERFFREAFDPERTMLGEMQVVELQNDLLEAERSGILWKFVVVPEPIQNLGPAAASDRFEGYAAERTRILKFIDDNDIGNVVFVAADIHGTIVNNLTYQLGPDEPQIDIPAFEITTGAVAYHPPFGPFIIELALQLGIIGPEQKALYDDLPRVGKDQFVQFIVNGVLSQFGYDFIGLDRSGIDAELLEGEYVSLHTYGWTQFDIAADDGRLTVTTWGIDFYDADTIDPDAEPFVVSKFVVRPAE